MNETPDPIWIEGYAGKVSLLPGEELTLHVATSGEKFEVEITRVGTERRSVYKAADLPGLPHAVPPDAATHGCRWPAAHSLAIPRDWPSGYYHVDLRVEGGGGAYTRRCSTKASSSCFFIVRNPNPGADAKILLQLATNTYNAYNNFNGRSLYAYHAADKVQGTRVSFERPPASLFPAWEEQFVRWAEGAGYKLDYAANLDLERDDLGLDAYNLVLSVGHDEYWSWGMRDRLEAFIAGGGNAAFFSGNTCCWQVRPEDGGRALVSFKQKPELDPLYGVGHDGLVSTLWSHHLVGRPENQLTGVGFLWGGYHRSHEQLMNGSGGYAVHRPEHWLFEGTGLARGQEFGAKDTIVGYECDGCEQRPGPDGLPVPTGRDGTPEDFVILATARAKWAPDDCEWYDRWEKGREGTATMGVYSRGGTVLTAATTDWSHGLAGGDSVVQRITRNALQRLSRRVGA